DVEAMSSDALLRRIRRRVEILRSLDPEALHDILRWGRRRVAANVSKSDQVREIITINRDDYDTLSHRGLIALARLRGLDVASEDHAESIVDKLREKEGFWPKFHRRRRRIVGALLERFVEAPTAPPPPVSTEGPSTEEADRRLRRQIEDHGVVGGIASRLRGAADSYIESKLDEIERRIDQKLEEIDRRMAEWRDREIANRLRILRITLAFTLLVALVSLGYNIVKGRLDKPPADVQSVE
ncbi:MAG: hypothetical protein KDA33_06455, partial [Phycisphaerales bacterium]|nr:hypothetical protein [Phycisphaerales bacterium]